MSIEKSFFKSLHLHKMIGLGISLIFLTTDTLGHAALPFNAPVPMPAQSFPDLSMPREWGTLQESFKGFSDKNILFIQDAHDSLEAQENIAQMIGYLAEKENIRTVFQEGYQGPVPTDEYFGFIKDAALRQKVSYFFLDHLRLSGAEYARINPRNPATTKNGKGPNAYPLPLALDWKLIGADNINLHLENIAWYRRTAEQKKETEEDFKALYEELRILSDRYFPKEFKEWLKLKDRLRQGEIPFLEYIQRSYAILTKAAPANRVSDPAFSSKQYPLIGALLVRDVKSLIDLRIQGLLEELKGLEKEIAAALLMNERDQKLYGYVRGLSLIRGLYGFEVMSEEYEEVQEIFKHFKTEDLANFVVRYGRKAVVLSRKWETNIESAFQFYQSAHERDKVIEDSLDNYFGETVEKKAVLVFGGFHTESITRMLKRKGWSYQVFSPRITEPSKRHQAYYRKIMGQGYHAYEIPYNLQQAVCNPGESCSGSILERAARPVDLMVMPGARAEVRAVHDAILALGPEKPYSTIRSAVENMLERGGVPNDAAVRSENRTLETGNLRITTGSLDQLIPAGVISPASAGGRSENRSNLFTGDEQARERHVAELESDARRISHTAAPLGRDEFYSVAVTTNDAEGLGEALAHFKDVMGKENFAEPIAVRPDSFQRDYENVSNLAIMSPRVIKVQPVLFIDLGYEQIERVLEILKPLRATDKFALIFQLGNKEASEYGLRTRILPKHKLGGLYYFDVRSEIRLESTSSQMSMPLMKMLAGAVVIALIPTVFMGVKGFASAHPFIASVAFLGVTGMIFRAEQYIYKAIKFPVHFAIEGMDFSRSENVRKSLINNRKKIEPELVQLLLGKIGYFRRQFVAEILKERGWQPTSADEKIAFYTTTGDQDNLVKVGLPAVPHLLRLLAIVRYFRHDIDPMAALLSMKVPAMEGFQVALREAEEWDGHDRLVIMRDRDIELLTQCLTEGRSYKIKYMRAKTHDGWYRPPYVDGPGDVAYTDTEVDDHGRLVLQEPHSENQLTSEQEEKFRMAVRGLSPRWWDVDGRERKEAAARTLGELQDPRAVPELLAALKDPEIGTSRAVTVALGRFDDPRIVPALIEQLRSKIPAIHEIAAEALRYYDDPMAVAALAGVDEAVGTVRGPRSEMRLRMNPDDLSAAMAKWIRRLPKAAGGKIDWKAAFGFERAGLENTSGPVPAHAELERTLRSVWRSFEKKDRPLINSGILSLIRVRMMSFSEKDALPLIMAQIAEGGPIGIGAGAFTIQKEGSRSARQIEMEGLARRYLVRGLDRIAQDLITASLSRLNEEQGNAVRRREIVEQALAGFFDYYGYATGPFKIMRDITVRFATMEGGLSYREIIHYLQDYLDFLQEYLGERTEDPEVLLQAFFEKGLLIRVRPEIELPSTGRSEARDFEFTSEMGIGLIDLTLLKRPEDYEGKGGPKQLRKDIVSLAERAKQEKVGAVCVYWDQVQLIELVLRATGIKIAAVVAFYKGLGTENGTSVEEAVRQAKAAIDAGANELDVVMNYGAVLEGRPEQAERELSAWAERVRAHAKRRGKIIVIKTILESGAYKNKDQLRDAIRVALPYSDFLKTSTGKLEVAGLDGKTMVVKGATLSDAEQILRAIGKRFKQTKKPVGFKASGGIKGWDDAGGKFTPDQQIKSYMELAFQILGPVLGQEQAYDYVKDPKFVRFGASGALDEMINAKDLVARSEIRTTALGLISSKPEAEILYGIREIGAVLMDGDERLSRRREAIEVLAGVVHPRHLASSGENEFVTGQALEKDVRTHLMGQAFSLAVRAEAVGILDKFWKTAADMRTSRVKVLKFLVFDGVLENLDLTYHANLRDRLKGIMQEEDASGLIDFKALFLLSEGLLNLETEDSLAMKATELSPGAGLVLRMRAYRMLKEGKLVDDVRQTSIKDLEGLLAKEKRFSGRATQGFEIEFWNYLKSKGYPRYHAMLLLDFLGMPHDVGLSQLFEVQSPPVVHWGTNADLIDEMHRTGILPRLDRKEPGGNRRFLSMHVSMVGDEAHQKKGALTDLKLIVLLETLLASPLSRIRTRLRAAAAAGIPYEFDKDYGGEIESVTPDNHFSEPSRNEYKTGIAELYPKEEFEKLSDSVHRKILRAIYYLHQASKARFYPETRKNLVLVRIHGTFREAFFDFLEKSPWEFLVRKPASGSLLRRVRSLRNEADRSRWKLMAETVTAEMRDEAGKVSEPFIRAIEKVMETDVVRNTLGDDDVQPNGLSERDFYRLSEKDSDFKFLSVLRSAGIESSRSEVREEEPATPVAAPAQILAGADTAQSVNGPVPTVDALQSTEHPVADETRGVEPAPVADVLAASRDRSEGPAVDPAVLAGESSPDEKDDGTDEDLDATTAAVTSAAVVSTSTLPVNSNLSSLEEQFGQLSDRSTVKATLELMSQLECKIHPSETSLADIEKIVHVFKLIVDPEYDERLSSLSMFAETHLSDQNFKATVRQNGVEALQRILRKLHHDQEMKEREKFAPVSQSIFNFLGSEEALQHMVLDGENIAAKLQLKISKLEKVSGKAQPDLAPAALRRLMVNEAQNTKTVYLWILNYLHEHYNFPKPESIEEGIHKEEIPEVTEKDLPNSRGANIAVLMSPTQGMEALGFIAVRERLKDANFIFVMPTTNIEVTGDGRSFLRYAVYVTRDKDDKIVLHYGKFAEPLAIDLYINSYFTTSPEFEKFARENKLPLAVPLELQELTMDKTLLAKVMLAKGRPVPDEIAYRGTPEEAVRFIERNVPKSLGITPGSSKEVVVKPATGTHGDGVLMTSLFDAAGHIDLEVIAQARMILRRQHGEQYDTVIFQERVVPIEARDEEGRRLDFNLRVLGTWRDGEPYTDENMWEVRYGLWSKNPKNLKNPDDPAKVLKLREFLSRYTKLGNEGSETFIRGLIEEHRQGMIVMRDWLRQRAREKNPDCSPEVIDALLPGFIGWDYIPKAGPENSVIPVTIEANSGAVGGIRTITTLEAANEKGSVVFPIARGFRDMAKAFKKVIYKDDAMRTTSSKPTATFDGLMHDRFTLRVAKMYAAAGYHEAAARLNHHLFLTNQKFKYFRRAVDNYLKASEYRPALVLIKSYLRTKKPMSILAWKLLGYVYKALNRPEEASLAWLRALQLGTREAEKLKGVVDELTVAETQSKVLKAVGSYFKVEVAAKVRSEVRREALVLNAVSGFFGVGFGIDQMLRRDLETRNLVVGLLKNIHGDGRKYFASAAPQRNAARRSEIRESLDERSWEIFKVFMSHNEKGHGIVVHPEPFLLAKKIASLNPGIFSVPIQIKKPGDANSMKLLENVLRSLKPKQSILPVVIETQAGLKWINLTTTIQKISQGAPQLRFLILFKQISGQLQDYQGISQAWDWAKGAVRPGLLFAPEIISSRTVVSPSDTKPSAPTAAPQRVTHPTARTPLPGRPSTTAAPMASTPANAAANAPARSVSRSEVRINLIAETVPDEERTVMEPAEFMRDVADRLMKALAKSDDGKGLNETWRSVKRMAESRKPAYSGFGTWENVVGAVGYFLYGKPRITEVELLGRLAKAEKNEEKLLGVGSDIFFVIANQFAPAILEQVQAGVRAIWDVPITREMPLEDFNALAERAMAVVSRASLDPEKKSGRNSDRSEVRSDEIQWELSRDLETIKKFQWFAAEYMQPLLEKMTSGKHVATNQAIQEIEALEVKRRHAVLESGGDVFQLFKTPERRLELMSKILFSDIALGKKIPKGDLLRRINGVRAKDMLRMSTVLFKTLQILATQKKRFSLGEAEKTFSENLKASGAQLNFHWTSLLKREFIRRAIDVVRQETISSRHKEQVLKLSQPTAIVVSAPLADMVADAALLQRRSRQIETPPRPADALPEIQARRSDIRVGGIAALERKDVTPVPREVALPEAAAASPTATLSGESRFDLTPLAREALSEIPGSSVTHGPDGQRRVNVPEALASGQGKAHILIDAADLTGPEHAMLRSEVFALAHQTRNRIGASKETRFSIYGAQAMHPDLDIFKGLSHVRRTVELPALPLSGKDARTVHISLGRPQVMLDFSTPQKKKIVFFRWKSSGDATYALLEELLEEHARQDPNGFYEARDGFFRAIAQQWMATLVIRTSA